MTLTAERETVFEGQAEEKEYFECSHIMCFTDCMKFGLAFLSFLRI